MPLHLFVFALAGLIVGGGAVLALPRLFPGHRGMTVLTGLCAALLIGCLSRAVLGSAERLYYTAPGSALGACVFVSLLAVPRRVAPGRARHAKGSRRRL